MQHSTPPPQLHQNPRPRGFSLLEITLVIVVIGILAAIAIPRLSRGVTGSADSALTADLAMLRTAIENYTTDHSGAFPSGATIAQQLTSRTDASGNVSASSSSAPYGPYLSTLPVCPVGARSGNSAIATTDAPSVGWIYTPATGVIEPDTTTECDATGKAYNTY